MKNQEKEIEVIVSLIGDILGHPVRVVVMSQIRHMAHLVSCLMYLAQRNKRRFMT